MKVLAVNKYAPSDPRRGGAEKRLGEVLQYISSKHDVHLLCAKSTTKCDLDGVQIHQPPLSNNVFAAHLLIFTLLPLYAAYLAPDVIYEDISVAPWLSHITCFWLPTVSIIHNFNGEQLWRRGQYVKGAMLSVLDWITVTLYRSKPVIVVSKHMEKILLQSGFNDVTTIYNGVERGLIQAEKSQKEPSKLLYLGRLEFRKGTDLLFKAWREALQDEYELHIAGRNEAGYSIPSSAQYHGFVTEEKKKRLLQDSYTLLVPSRWEGYGIVVLEARATNTGVVANDAPGLREAVNDIGGTLTDFDKPSNVYDAVRSMSKKDIATVSGKINSWTCVAEETEEILKNEIREE